MKLELAHAFARLRSALTNPSPRAPKGTARVLAADLELLLAEVEALSNAQMARYLVRIVLEELRNGNTEASGNTPRQLERRGRRHPVLRGAYRSPADRRVAEITGPYQFTPDGDCIPPPGIL